MRILNKIHAIFSGDAIEFTCPKSWEELTRQQLVYILYLVNHFPMSSVKTYALARFCGISPVEKKPREGWVCDVKTNKGKKRIMMPTAVLASMTHCLDFLDNPERYTVRLDDAGGCFAVHRLLRGVPFQDYLTAENYYQAFLIKKDMAMLDAIGRILYLDKKGRMKKGVKFSYEERTNILFWWMNVKDEFSRLYPHFFVKAAPGEVGQSDMREAVNAQIRALTGGDVTKEEYILSIDCHRALTELDAKAKEYNELKKIKK